MDLHFHVNHSGDAARLDGDPPTLRQWPTSGRVHESKPNSFPDRRIWHSLRQPCRKPNGFWALDNNGLTMAMFLLVPRYLPLWVDFRQQP